MIKINVQKRQPIWIALSDFYLDTELQVHDFKHIAVIIKSSSYSLEDVKAIDKEEIFPVLYKNLLSVAGIWSGFEEKWLVEEITKNLQKRRGLKKLMLNIKYASLKWMCADYWKRLEAAYKEI